MELDRIIAVTSRKTVYRDGERCLKVFLGGRTETDVLREAMNQTALREAGLPVPPVLQVTAVDGHPAIVSAFIHGKTLARRLSESPEEADALLERLVALQKKMHKKAGAPLFRLTELLRQLPLPPELSADETVALRRRFTEVADRDRILHGDFSPENLLEGEQGTLFILDCCRACAGDPAFDAALTYGKLLLTDALPPEKYLAAYAGGDARLAAHIRRLFPVAAAFLLPGSAAASRRRWLDWLKTELKIEEERS